VINMTAIAAVLTAYHPDERLLTAVAAALESCAEVIVADNTPAGSVSLADELDDPRVRVLRSGRNVGVAAGLNEGIAALSRHIEAVLILDQDTLLPVGLAHGLAKHLDDPSVGAAAPTPLDAARQNADPANQAPATPADGGDGLAEQPAVITSGMLIRRSRLDEVGGFREDFFVDWVDVDFCIRLRATGARIVQDRRLFMPHSFGDTRLRGFGPAKVRVVLYPAWRHYWIARNGWILTSEQARADRRQAARTGVFLMRWLVTTTLFQPSRPAHIRALLRGYRDGAARRVTATYLPAGAHYPGSVPQVDGA
jgi:rhamnosyltransferase